MSTGLLAPVHAGPHLGWPLGPSALGVPVEVRTVHPSLPRPIPTLDTRRWDLWSESTCLCRGHCAAMRGHGSVLLTCWFALFSGVGGRCICSFWLVGAAERAEEPQAGRGVQGWSHEQWYFKLYIQMHFIPQNCPSRRFIIAVIFPLLKQC